MAAEFRRIAGLATPILGMQLTMIGMMSIDTIMSGRFGITDLAAIGISGAIYVAVLVVLTGVANGITPVAARLWGSGSMAELGAILRTGMVLSLACAVAAYPVLLGTLFTLVDSDPPVMEMARDILGLLAIGLPAVLLYRLLFAIESAAGRPVALMWINVVGLLCKIPLNMVLMEVPIRSEARPAGAVGCAAATTIIAWASLVAAGYIFRKGRAFEGIRVGRPMGFSLGALMIVLRASVPVSAVQFVEIMAYSGMAVLIARAGATASAAHQIAANIATCVFMLPLSIAIAAGTLISRHAGAHDDTVVRRLFRSGLILVCLVGGGSMLCLLTSRSWLATAFSNDAQVTTVASLMLVWVAISQLADAIQIYFCIVLRSYHIVWPAVGVALVLRCGLGLGLGFWLAYGTHGHGPVGFWIGGFVALCVSAIVLGMIFRQQLMRQQRPFGQLRSGA